MNIERCVPNPERPRNHVIELTLLKGGRFSISERYSRETARAYAI